MIQPARLDFIDRPINPDTPRLFTVVSTFAGAGGSSLGYKWAGGEVLAAVEWDQNAVDTYRLNHTGTPVLHRDIATVTAQELFDLCGVGPGELDILDGSPPCQGFSTAGKRQMDDPRNGLFREYVRLLRDLQPRAFVMENVSGMVKGKMKLIFADILTELKSCGYVVKAWLLNAKYFGVPQSRERMIFIGAREDLGIAPTCPKALIFSDFITLGQCLRGLDIDGNERQFLLDAGQKYVAYQDWARIPLGKNRGDLGLSGFNCIRPDPRRPCPTVRKNDGEISMHGVMHWAEQRRFTTGEFKRIQSFPDRFEFLGGWEMGVQRIGNSVPPRFMEAIASHVYETILKPTNVTA